MYCSPVISIIKSPLRHKLVPDLLMGDFDSIGSELPDDIETESSRPEKDFTDLELAIMKAVDLAATEVCIIGGIGGRLDHTVANIQLLSHYSNTFDSLYMMDGRNICFIINGGDYVTVSVPYAGRIPIYHCSRSPKHARASAHAMSNIHLTDTLCRGRYRWA
ncbi:MAG: thiamine diphosphokinase [Anaerovoracaceae bacterium]